MKIGLHFLIVFFATICSFSFGFAQTGITNLNPHCNCEISLVLKPNPVADWLTIKHTIPKGAQINIVDVTGKAYLSKVVEMETQLSVTGWPKGVYFVTLSVGEGEQVDRLTSKLAIW